MFVTTLRVMLGVIGVAMFAGGLVVLTSGVAPAPAGLWGLVGGAVLIVAVTLERLRYRSEAAEKAALDVGPGGGEPDVPLAPFRATEERFIDPTSGRVMRVYVNPGTGERRYRAEA